MTEVVGILYIFSPIYLSVVLTLVVWNQDIQ